MCIFAQNQNKNNMLFIYNTISMQYERFKFRNVFIIIIGLMIAVSIITYIATDKTPQVTVYEPPIDIKVTNEMDFTRENLIKYLKQLNIKYPHIVFAQAQLETGYFTSDIFKENNNLFGMRQAYQRATTAKGTQYKHAYYDHWQSSVLDYGLYSNKYLSKLKSEKAYFKYLKDNYAEDKTYVPKLKQIIEKNAEIVW